MRKLYPMAYREDGWPLCPSCGDDELYSTFTPGPPRWSKTLTDYLSAGPLRCYRCPKVEVHCYDQR